jgi:ssDNA-binding Zn-finger/Zn-ribbon topoisomerase 1
MPEQDPAPQYYLAKRCHQCDKGKMVLRKSRRTGETFLGCNRYPDCTGTVAHDDFTAAMVSLLEELTRKVLVYERRAAMRVVPNPEPPDSEPAA